MAAANEAHPASEAHPVESRLAAAHYELVYDPNQIREWCDYMWTPHDTHMIMIAARKKYVPDVKVKAAFVLRRDIVNEPGRLLDAIRQYEFPVDALKDDAGNPIPNAALAVYVTLNPRDPLRAVADLAVATTQHLQRRSVGADDVAAPRVVSLAKSLLQTACLKKQYLTVDIDDKALFGAVVSVIDPRQTPIQCIVETRGGFHIILDLKNLTPEGDSALRLALRAWPKTQVELLRDQNTPVPGTVQGGFRVRFVFRSWDPHGKLAINSC